MNRRDFIALAALSALIPLAKASASEAGSFDNDDALEWAHQCAQSRGNALIYATLNTALQDGYLEARDGAAAVAAAEVVAAAKGRENGPLPDDLVVWLAHQEKAVVAKLAPLAANAISRILHGPQSGLREQWQENEQDFPTWEANMQNLLTRLM
jgi:hypothetical protein